MNALQAILGILTTALPTHTQHIVWGIEEVEDALAEVRVGADAVIVMIGPIEPDLESMSESGKALHFVRHFAIYVRTRASLEAVSAYDHYESLTEQFNGAVFTGTDSQEHVIVLAPTEIDRTAGGVSATLYLDVQ